MNGILGSSRFQRDYEEFKSKIDKIEDLSDKIEAESLLRELVLHIKKMDSMHQEMSYTYTLSTLGNDLRENIRNTRIKLNKKIKECSK